MFKKIFAPRVVFFFSLAQDLDVLLPSIQELKRRNVKVTALITLRLARKSPRIIQALRSTRVGYSLSTEWDEKLNYFFNLLFADAIVTAADTSAGAHRKAHALVIRAKQKGIKTYTFQHGLENIGLTYFDEEFPPGSVVFPSDRIFVWGDKSLILPEVSDEVRNKCVSVGCPKSYKTESDIRVPHDRKTLVSIFENLHWGRYDEDYRRAFLKNLDLVISSFPEITFLVKPHHAGKWLTEKYKGSIPTANNLIVANPSDKRWEPFTAPAIIAISDAIISTPSTTTFDAAYVEKPVAVVTNNMNLNAYDPLTKLRSSQDWVQFLTNLKSKDERENYLCLSREFCKKVSLPGSGAHRVVDIICNDLAQ